MSELALQNPLHERTLALGALVHCAAIVHGIANSASVGQDSGNFAMDAPFLLQPVLHRGSDPTSALLPAGPQRQRMLQRAMSILSGEVQTARVMTYVIELIELARRLRNHQVVVRKLGGLLDQTPEPDADALANIYQQTISTLGRRIQVTGDPGLLQQPQVASRIRAMLLAGVRYAWLWHQLGGRRWHLIVNRRALLRAMQALENAS